MIGYPRNLRKKLRSLHRRAWREKKSCFETTSEIRSLASYYHDPEQALRAERLISAETDPEADRSLAIANLAVDDRARFVELVEELPHVIQDIFFQYYLLGRTQTQIGYALGRSQTAVWQQRDLGLEAICACVYFGGPPTVDQMTETGVPREAALYADDYRKTRSFVVVADWHRTDPGTVRRTLLSLRATMSKGDREHRLLGAWFAALLFRAAPEAGMVDRERQRTKRLNVRAGKRLGAFVVRADDSKLEEWFAAGTTDGPVSRSS